MRVRSHLPALPEIFNFPARWLPDRRWSKTPAYGRRKHRLPRVHARRAPPATRRRTNGGPIPALRRWKSPGREPLAVSAASVNCGTSSSSPPISVRLKFIFPAASGKTRYCSRRCEQPSRPEPRHRRDAPRPRPAVRRPMAPTRLSSIRTSAWETRCSKPIILGLKHHFLQVSTGITAIATPLSDQCICSVEISDTLDRLFSPQSGSK